MSDAVIKYAVMQWLLLWQLPLAAYPLSLQSCGVCAIIKCEANCSLPKFNPTAHADVAEMADALASGASGQKARAGSTPAVGIFCLPPSHSFPLPLVAALNYHFPLAFAMQAGANHIMPIILKRLWKLL